MLIRGNARDLRRVDGGKKWSPARLFAAGEQGAWYDPSDLSTLFQDSAFTVPVTAVEQPVGGMLDLSGRGNHASQATTTKRPVYSRRVNLLTQTEQFDDAAWGRRETPGSGTASAPVVIPNDDGVADKVTFAATGAGISELRQVISLTKGDYYGYIRIKAATAGDVGKVVGFRHAAGGAYLLITLEAEYQNVGRAETAATDYSAEFAVALRPDVGTSSGTVAVHIESASLTLAIDAHLPYQYVNTATDYDADPAKFPAYLCFDGVDDALQTGNIDFTGTDKVTVWAGITKLSDAAIGMIVELSTNSDSTNGTFNLAASVSGNTYWTQSRGTVRSTQTATGYVAPNSAVLVAEAKISTDTLRLHVNNAAPHSSATDQGTGNYGNYPIYIGARAGTSFFFNGRLYGLIVRGAQSSLSQIEATELYIKQKARIA